MIPLLKLRKVLIVIQIMCQTFRKCRSVDFVIILPPKPTNQHHHSNQPNWGLGIWVVSVIWLTWKLNLKLLLTEMIWRQIWGFWKHISAAFRTSQKLQMHRDVKTHWDAIILSQALLWLVAFISPELKIKVVIIIKNLNKILLYLNSKLSSSSSPSCPLSSSTFLAPIVD